MGNCLSVPLHAVTDLPPYWLINDLSHHLARCLERHLPLRDCQSPSIHRPRALRPRSPVRSQDPEREDDTASQLRTCLISTRDLEDVPPPQQLPPTLPRFLGPQPSMDHEPEETRGRIKTCVSEMAENAENLPGPEDTPEGKETPGLEETTEYSTNRAIGIQLRENKEETGAVSPEFPELKSTTWNCNPRASAFRLVIRKGVVTPFVPRSGPLNTRDRPVVQACLGLCRVCTRMHGGSTYTTPGLDLHLKDGAVPEPSSSGRRGLVYSPAVQGTLRPSSVTRRVLGKPICAQGVVEPSPSAHHVLGPPTFVRTGFHPVHSQQGGLRQSSSPQMYPKLSTSTQTRPRHGPSEQEVLRPSRSLQEGVRLSLSPKRGNRCSQPRLMRLPPAPSAKECVQTSPIEEEVLKHSLSSTRDPSSTSTPQESPTTPTSAKGDLEPRTSAQVFLHSFPSAQGDLDNSSAVTGSLGLLPFIQRYRELPTYVQGAEGALVSFPRFGVLSVASQWSFSPLPSHDGVTHPHVPCSDPMCSISTQTCLRQVSCAQQGFRPPSTKLEGFKHTHSTTRDRSPDSTIPRSLSVPLLAQEYLQSYTEAEGYLQHSPSIYRTVETSSTMLECQYLLPSTQCDLVLSMCVHAAEGFGESFQGFVVLSVLSQYIISECAVSQWNFRYFHSPDTVDTSSTSPQAGILQHLLSVQWVVETLTVSWYGSLPPTQRHLGFSTSAQGFELLSLTFQRSAVFSVVSQRIFSPLPSHDDITGYPAICSRPSCFSSSVPCAQEGLGPPSGDQEVLEHFHLNMRYPRRHGTLEESVSLLISSQRYLEPFSSSQSFSQRSRTTHGAMLSSSQNFVCEEPHPSIQRNMLVEKKILN